MVAEAIAIRMRPYQQLRDAQARTQGLTTAATVWVNCRTRHRCGLAAWTIVGVALVIALTRDVNSRDHRLRHLHAPLLGPSKGIIPSGAASHHRYRIGVDRLVAVEV
jgi:hypothetical protein